MRRRAGALHAEACCALLAAAASRLVQTECDAGTCGTRMHCHMHDSNGARPWMQVRGAAVTQSWWDSGCRDSCATCIGGPAVASVPLRTITAAGEVMSHPDAALRMSGYAVVSSGVWLTGVGVCGGGPRCAASLLRWGFQS